MTILNLKIFESQLKFFSNKDLEEYIMECKRKIKEKEMLIRVATRELESR